MKTIICGGRRYALTGDDFAWLDAMREALPITEVVSGHYGKADLGAEEWARRNRITATLFPPNWGLFKFRAGPIRNSQMAKYCEADLPAACIAFPGNEGTSDMVRKATRDGLRVIEAHAHPLHPKGKPPC